MSSTNLVLNSSNVSNSNKNTYKLRINGGLTIQEKTKVCLTSLTVPYSWFNISAFYGNNQFKISHVSIANFITWYTITIPDGFYTIDDLNLFLQQELTTRGLYMLKGTVKVFFYQFVLSTTYYSVQLICSLVPNAALATTLGYTMPSSGLYAAGPPLNSGTALFEVNNAGFGTLIGFELGQYPPTADTVSRSFLSTKTPVGSTVQSLLIRCNLVNNKLSYPSDVLDSVTINNSFGSNITYTPSFAKFINCQSGTFSSVDVSICDQNGNEIKLLDSNCLITLLLTNDS